MSKTVRILGASAGPTPNWWDEEEDSNSLATFPINLVTDDGTHYSAIEVYGHREVQKLIIDTINAKAPFKSEETINEDVAK